MKWCMDYETGEYGYIDENGYNMDRGEFTFNWDHSEYDREREEKHHRGLFGLFDDEDD